MAALTGIAIGIGIGIGLYDVNKTTTSRTPSMPTTPSTNSTTIPTTSSKTTTSSTIATTSTTITTSSSVSTTTIPSPFANVTICEKIGRCSVSLVNSVSDIICIGFLKCQKFTHTKF